MYRFTILLALLFIFSSNLSAQNDALIKSNGDTLYISVIEINERYLIYTKKGFGEKVFTTHINKLDKIIYANNDVYDFSSHNERLVNADDEYYNELYYGNGFFGPSIRDKHKKLSASEVLVLYREVGNYEAVKLYKDGRAINIFGNILGIPSGYILGDQLYKAISDNHDNNGTMVLVGAIGSVISVILNVRGINKIKKSVELFNNTIYLDAGSTENGMGFLFKF